MKELLKILSSGIIVNLISWVITKVFESKSESLTQGFEIQAWVLALIVGNGLLFLGLFVYYLVRFVSIAKLRNENVQLKKQIIDLKRDIKLKDLELKKMQSEEKILLEEVEIGSLTWGFEIGVIFNPSQQPDLEHFLDELKPRKPYCTEHKTGLADEPESGGLEVWTVYYCPITTHELRIPEFKLRKLRKEAISLFQKKVRENYQLYWQKYCDKVRPIITKYNYPEDHFYNNF